MVTTSSSRGFFGIHSGVCLLLCCLLLGRLISGVEAAETLAGTAPLTLTGDLAAQMVSGIDRYLDRVLAGAPQRRMAFWKREPGSLDAQLQAVQPLRERLRTILGVVDARDPVQMQFLAPAGTQARPPGAEIARGDGYRIYAVSWNVFRGVTGEGLLLQPDGAPKADIIAIPDCDWAPEQLAGLQEGVPAEWQFARRFAEAGCRVLVPCLIDRSDRFSGNPGVRLVRHSQRETLWRASYEMGRTPVGYEIQKVLAAADWFQATRQGTTEPAELAPWLEQRAQAPQGVQRLGLFGYGEGGLVAFYAGALDTRFRAVAISGYFGPRDHLWTEPIYRNVWSLLARFADAEIAQLILPRPLLIEYGRYPQVTHTDQFGGAPAVLATPTKAEVEVEIARATQLGGGASLVLVHEPGGVGGWAAAAQFYRQLQPGGDPLRPNMAPLPHSSGALPDQTVRQRRQYAQILEDTQWLMREAEYTRAEFWRKADRKDATSFAKSAQWYREYFRDEVVGRLPEPSLAPNPRSRLLYETNGFRGYEVVLDVYPEVFAYGILLVPGDLKPGDKRPAVVCQHGLEGRPKDVADPNYENPAYHRYACRLAAQGFVTFAPQNPYIGATRFRQVLRKAQPLGLTLFSFIVRQHQVITDWLAGLDNVDPTRIAFYGLSYGGKTAMRVPPLVDRYCLSICSADYNEWIWKNVSARSPYSYLWTMEYDMPEFNLGNTFNYAELSWLIFPRPFMVERGHDDGVAPDEWVAYEYAKTRRLYVKLGLAERTRIEFFNGPHSIHGQGTFEFLHQQLRWP